MNNTPYPLGHSATELERLDTQATLLHDALFDQLVHKSKSCLEIGCGNGSNLKLIKDINPHISYTGIDIAPEAIEAAKQKYNPRENVTFLVSDAKAINFKTQFDFVFTKLVLWSVGDQWRDIIRDAHQILAPGGAFYALEPYNRLIQLHPLKPRAQLWMNQWDEAAMRHGFNPNIGIEVAAELIKAGFKAVNTKFFPVISMGTNREKYNAIINNLTGFYMGPAAKQFGLGVHDTEEAFAALNEFQTVNDESLVMDSLFISWGFK